MFEHPEEHAVTMLRPSACYRHIYPKPWNLARISYFFEHQLDSSLPPPDAYAECIGLVETWKRRWRGPQRPRLTYVKTWGSISIHDSREQPTSSIRYDGPYAALYEACADARERDELVELLACDTEWLDAALAGFVERRLMISLDGAHLALALPQNPHY